MDAAGIRQATTTDNVTGVATSTVSGTKTLTCKVNGTEVTVRALRDVTVGVGDIVALTRYPGYGLVVIGRLLAAAPADDSDSQAPPPAPQQGTIHGTTNFAPVETRSYRTAFGGQWRTDNDSVYQGESGGFGNHTGCAFYGNGPRSLKGATVTAAHIRAKRLPGSGVYGAQSTTLRRITNKTRPGGAPTLVAGSASGPHLATGATDTTISIPTSYAQALVDGTAGGLAIFDSSGDPYVRLAGRSDWSSAWILTISWSRTT